MVGALNVFVFIMIISFVIERVVKAILFVLLLIGHKVGWLGRLVGGSSEVEAEEHKMRHKLIYFLIAALLAAGVCWFFDEIRVLKLLIGTTENPWLDFFVTWIVFLGGSDFVGRILAVSGVGDIGAGYSPVVDARGATRKEPLEVVGTLKLENSDGIGITETKHLS